MLHSIGIEGLPVIGAGVEPASPPVGGDGSTRAPMKPRRPRSTFCVVNFKDLAPPSNEGPPRALRVLGLIAMAAVLSSTLFTDPKPSLHGDGLLVIAGFICLASGLFLAARREEQFEYARFIGLSLVGIGSIICAAVQPDSAGYAGVYFVVAIGGIRLGRDGAIIVCGGTVGGLVLIQLLDHENAAVVVGTLFSVLPVVLGDAADPPARRAHPPLGGAGGGAARVARRARGVRGAGRARPRRARAARRARALVERAGAATRRLAPAGPRPRRRPRGRSRASSAPTISP